MGEWRVRDAEAASHAFQTQFTVTDHSAALAHRDRFADSADLVRRALSLGASTWADYGCGTGGLLSMVDGFTAKWGVDFWEGAADAARQRGLDIRVADIENAELDYADLATATELLEHIDDPHRFLARVPCRWFAASVPFHETADGSDPAHVWVWDPDGFRALVEGAGLAVLSHTWRGLGQHILAERLP